MKVTSLQIILISLIGFCQCQIPGVGKCPENIKAIANLDVKQYLGKWYEHSKYPFIFEIGGKCITAEYDLINDKTVSVLNSQQMVFGRPSNISGTAELTEESGKLLVTFASAPFKANYWVLDTDYTSYAVVYSCNQFLADRFHTTVVWILTRAQKPTPETVEKARKVLVDNGISLNFMILTNQSNC